MIKVPKLAELCGRIWRAEPRWDSIRQRYQRIYGPRDFVCQYAKELSEMHLDICLEDLAPEFGIVFRPELKQLDDLRFSYSASGRLVTSHKKNACRDKKQFEYDSVVTINGIPVDFEITLASFNGHSKKGARKSPVTAIRSEIYCPRHDPLRRSFGSDVGYVLVVASEVYERLCANGNGDYHLFLRENGHVVPFYCSRAEFRQEVMQKLKEWSLPFTETDQM